MNHRNTIICLTPVKNESWILDKFLAAASLWADHIIIADQMSDDGSREIAGKYSKVIMVDNTSTVFNEPERQQILFNEGRKISGPKVFIALDADEFLTANYEQSPEWNQILYAPSGTVFHFNWVNIMPGFKRGWIVRSIPHNAIVDDGSTHTGPEIHSPRIPRTEHATYINLTDIKVLHYQFTDWERMQSKHCWYQCYECINFPEKKIVSMYRMYHHMDVFLKRKEYTITLEDKWFDTYIKRGIEMKVINKQEYWWDQAVVNLMREYGTMKFSKAQIWYRNWNLIKLKYVTDNALVLNDPRTIVIKIIHWYLMVSQPYKTSIPVRIIDRFLKIAGF